jgi:alkanesulfonate monooxygenase SsuD/methylene tetrahydromethanopterin reductase-like flavin-dependent oxidoreductase (luciferase family)
MKIGLIVPMGDELQPEVPQRWVEIKALAIGAEEAGLDSVWVYDHLLSGGPEAAAESPWEAWTLLTALAAVTTRVRLGPLVLCVPFREPAVLARMADTLQEISADRIVLGLGCGWHKPEFEAFGLPFDERVSRFAEGLEIITDMVRTGRSTKEGRHYRTASAPVREREGRVAPEILVAARRPRMMRLVAKHADAWNIAWYGVPGPAYREVAAAMTATCEEVGRDRSTLRTTVGFRIATDESAEDPTRLVQGGADAVAAAIAAWESEGVDELICWPEPNNQAGLDLLVDGVNRYRAARSAG